MLTQFLDSLAKSIDVGVIVFDLDNIYIMNDNAKEILGDKINTIFDILTIKYYQRILKVWEEESYFKEQMIVKSFKEPLSLKFVSISFIITKEFYDKKKKGICFIKDLTDEKYYHQNMDEYEKAYDIIVRNMCLGYLSFMPINYEGINIPECFWKVYNCNSYFYNWFGKVIKGDVLKMSMIFYMTLKEIQELRNMTKSILEAQSPKTYEIELKSKIDKKVYRVILYPSFKGGEKLIDAMFVEKNYFCCDTSIKI